MESRGKGTRRGFTLALAAWLALLAASELPASAQEPVDETPLTVYGDAQHPGTIHLLVYGPPGAHVLVFEQVGAELLPLRAVDLDPVGALWNIASWRCDRRERRFVLTTTRPDGSVSSAAYETRTPSCRNRMALRLPRKVRPGSAVTARISDRWRNGGVRPRLCVAPPAAGSRCRTIALRRGRALATPRLRFGRKGTWRVETRLAGHRVRRLVRVGGGGVARDAPARTSVLLSGDSMMLNIDSYVTDRLRGRAHTVSDTRVGTGLSKPGFSWTAHARRQMRRRRPDATVVFIGANDAFDMRTPDGSWVACCSEPWIAEYARRAATLMRVYRRHGQASSVWLTIPAPRSDDLRVPIAAVNEGIRRAASVSPGVRLLKLDEFFTPGFSYRAEMSVRGRIRRVRADDGLHLSLLGAEIAASMVARHLRAVGVL